MKRAAMFGLMGLTVFTLGACDDDDSTGAVTELSYTGNFLALNASGVTGVADVLSDDQVDDFEVSIEAGELAPSITHAQHIHSAAECPTMADDANGDGFVDVVEGLPSYGGILIPLDTDLPDQAAGAFPTADASGVIDYRESSSLTALLDGIRGEDADMFVELGQTEPLAPEDRTVVLHGVPSSTDLPESVQSLEGLPATATLPVACAELERIETPVP